MKIQEIIFHLRNVLNGRPWYGKSIVEIVSRVKREDERIRQLLGHMLAWRAFTLGKVNGRPFEIEIGSEKDWPSGNLPLVAEALDALKLNTEILVAQICAKDDEWLRGKVEGTEYNFQFLLEGLIQHDIYHLGQIAILQKMTTG